MSDDSAGGSIAFDRAVEYYDRTRALPPDVQTQVTEVLDEELSGRGVCFEPGIGTGRMALPLVGRGVPVVGADISLPMMERLAANAGGQAPVALVRADVTQLPFADEAFGGAYLCHVLHLVPGWRKAAAELVRVVRPKGLILIDLGGSPTTIGAAVFREFERRTGQQLRPGCNDPDELDETMAASGAALQRTRAISVTLTWMLREQFDRLERNETAATWRLDDDARTRAVNETRVWAEEIYGPVDQPHTETFDLIWRVYQVS